MMNNETDTSPPTMLASDYAQVVIFSVLVIVGLPVNISTLIYMLRRYRHAKSFLLLLHINLNISDILVLGVYVPGLVGWLISHDWLAGNAMCKFMRFFDGFVLAISSNVMVCIAVYRLCALRYPLWISAVGHSRIPRMLVMAWGIAAISMSPQLFIWKEVELPNVVQCMSVWVEKLSSETDTMTDEDFWWMKFYSIHYVVIIFYIPVSILIFCYVLILKDIYKTLNNEEGSSAMYMSEISKLSTCGRNKENSQEKRKEKESFVSIRTLRGQDKFRRAKVRSLRITLMLILTYVITWLPYNLLCWWLVLSFNTYRDYQDVTYPMTILVVLNSVINPFIYGRYCSQLRRFKKVQMPRTKIAAFL